MWTFWTKKVDFLNLTTLTLLQKNHSLHPPGYGPDGGGAAVKYKTVSMSNLNY